MNIEPKELHDLLFEFFDRGRELGANEERRKMKEMAFELLSEDEINEAIVSMPLAGGLWMGADKKLYISKDLTKEPEYGQGENETPFEFILRVGKEVKNER